ncbi:MAG: Histidine kinase [Peltula sp. TS41687]|nr:MAG: Histidine kinase [Peltula sp. TS41687]
MRISIREQLGLLVLLTSLTALAVIAVATWINNSSFVVTIRSSGLALTASLKAAQVAASLLLLQSTVETVSTRVLIQNALRRYRDEGNNTDNNWLAARKDLQVALAGGNTLLLQAIIFPANANDPSTLYGLLNVTSGDIHEGIPLPFEGANGVHPMLGESGMGFPPTLYPNLTYPTSSGDSPSTQSTAPTFNGRRLERASPLLLGPVAVNATFALLSLTVAVVNNTSASDVLGYMTVVVDSRLIYDIVSSPEGLENAGGTLIIGPHFRDNQFPEQFLSNGFIAEADNGTATGDLQVKILWAPLPPNSSAASRHARSAFDKPEYLFPMKAYPAVLSAYTRNNGAVNNAGSMIDSSNEEGKNVAVGYARPRTSLCEWVLIVEQDHYQAVSPVRHLRNVLLACVFGTIGLILLAVFPIAHFSVRPIRRLRQATKDSVEPPGYDPAAFFARSSGSQGDEIDQPGMQGDEESPSKEAKGFLGRRLSPWRGHKQKDEFRGAIGIHGDHVRVPKKVPDRHHYVEDELTDLTRTFNEMSDELMTQYERLEERVKERTRELELSKKAAEAANESKTLFIANISHEFRTPLNAILGLTAVCMEEADMARIQRSLGIIYKSGDLLLNLLTDLLTFSKNQVGQQLSLDEKEFRMGDITAQILSIFEKQATEGKIDLRATFFPPDHDLGPKSMISEVTRLKDLYVWGDQNRLLQVIINLVSNSLKFTPPGQSIELRIKCLAEVESSNPSSSRKVSTNSRANSLRPLKLRKQHSGSSGVSPGAADDSPGYLNTALSINAMEPDPLRTVPSRDRSPSPLVHHAQTYLFEFEVEDTGPGIPEHLQERVFEPFVQGDLGLSKKYGGTGLGLSICAQLAKLMGGSITLRSQIDVGSVFTMRIPLKVTGIRPASNGSSIHGNSRPNSVALAKPADDGFIGMNGVKSSDDLMAPSMGQRAGSSGSLPLTPDSNSDAINTVTTGSAPRLVGLSQPFFAPSPSQDSPPKPRATEVAVPEAPSPGGRIRVLVAEDNMVNQEVVLRMLRLEDIYDVTVAKDGQEAYDKVKESMAQKRTFHLIFMDVQMPNLDGLQSTRLIREVGFSSPIVALTAFAEESNYKECIKSGMNSFLAKPIRRPALKAILKAYCPPIPEEREDDDPLKQGVDSETQT